LIFLSKPKVELSLEANKKDFSGNYVSDSALFALGKIFPRVFNRYLSGGEEYTVLKNEKGENTGL